MRVKLTSTKEKKEISKYRHGGKADISNEGTTVRPTANFSKAIPKSEDSEMVSLIF